VNRPLAAFGALMTFLVLAMFAVSSTGRSTSVQAARPGKRWASIPAGEGSPEISDFRFQISDLEDGGEDDGSEPGDARCGRVMAETYLTSLRIDGKRKSELSAVRIVPAADANEAWPTTVLESCLSYFHVECDWILSQGAKDHALNFQGPKIQQPRGMDDEEMVAVFFGLVNANGGLPGVTKDVGGTVAEQVVGTAHPTFWFDYAELIDGARNRLALTADTAKTSGSNEGVRSSDWLRHSAALSLYRVGALLQAVALGVDQAGEKTSGRTDEALAR
jgi:hypothetical protein